MPDLTRSTGGWFLVHRLHGLDGTAAVEYPAPPELVSRFLHHGDHEPVTQPLYAPPLPCKLCRDGRLYGDDELLPHLREHHPNPDPGPYLSTACLLGLCAAFDRCGCAQAARGEPGPPARKYDAQPCLCSCHEQPTQNGDPSA